MQFLFTESAGKLSFLICQETIAILKEHNLKRHYQSRHEAKYNSIRGKEREDKIKQLMKLVRWQQTAIAKFAGIDDWVKASFIYQLPLHYSKRKFVCNNLQFDAVMNAANDVVKFIQAKASNHRQFQNFLTVKCEANHGDMIYYCNIRWLSHAKVLKRIAELKRYNKRIHDHENKPIFEFDDPKFVADFAFLADISSHLATFNLKLQQRG